MEFLKATKQDIKEIKNLYLKFFTNDEVEDLNFEDENTFYICKEDNKIVAVSQIIKPEDTIYNGYEIGYTCTDLNYRKKGISTTLISNMIKDIPNGTNIFGSCWRIRNNDINMKSVMRILDFKLVQQSRVWYDSNYNKDCCTCPMREDNKVCKCYEDLYMFKKIN